VSDHRRHAGRHARSGFRLQRLLAPLVLVVLVTVAGIGWALALTSNHEGATNQAAVTSRPADPTVAPTTITPTTVVALPSSTHSTVASTRTSTATSSSTTQSRTTSLLQGTMARPNGVAAQMNVDFGGADSIPCWGIYEHQPEKPTIAVNGRTDPSVTAASIASPIQICLFRFDAGRPVQVTIRSPAGREERLTAPPPCAAVDCTTETAWGPLPGDPLGDYDVTAVQPDRSAKAKIIVEAAHGRSLMVIGSTTNEVTRLTVRPGTPIGIAIAGFLPRQSIGLLFYYTPSFEVFPKGLRFQASTTATTDASGGAVVWLATSPTDPLGCYLVNTLPPLRTGTTDPRALWASQSSWEQFCLQR
jgi:hypothetical protein